MSQLRFNHVFIFLMSVSGLSAFVMPRGSSDWARGKIDNLFIPISEPVHGLAQSVNSRWGQVEGNGTDGQEMPRSVRDWQQELERRDLAIANLSAQLDELRKREKAQEA